MKKILITVLFFLAVVSVGVAGSFLIDCAEELEANLEQENALHAFRIVEISNLVPIDYQALYDELDRHMDTVDSHLFTYMSCCCVSNTCPC